MKKHYNSIIFSKKKFIPFKTKSEVKTTNSWNHMSITDYSKFIKKLNRPLLSNLRSFQNLNFIYNSYNENIYPFFCSTISNMKQLRIKKVKFVKINKKKSFKFCKHLYKFYGKKEYLSVKEKKMVILIFGASLKMIKKKVNKTTKKIKKRYYNRFINFAKYKKIRYENWKSFRKKTLEWNIKKNINFTILKNIYRKHEICYTKKEHNPVFYKTADYFSFWYKHFHMYQRYIQFFYKFFFTEIFTRTFEQAEKIELKNKFPILIKNINNPLNLYFLQSNFKKKLIFLYKSSRKTFLVLFYNNSHFLLYNAVLKQLIDFITSFKNFKRLVQWNGFKLEFDKIFFDEEYVNEVVFEYKKNAFAQQQLSNQVLDKNLVEKKEFLYAEDAFVINRNFNEKEICNNSKIDKNEKAQQRFYADPNIKLLPKRIFYKNSIVYKFIIYFEQCIFLLFRKFKKQITKQMFIFFLYKTKTKNKKIIHEKTYIYFNKLHKLSENNKRYKIIFKKLTSKFINIYHLFNSIRFYLNYRIKQKRNFKFFVFKNFKKFSWHFRNLFYYIKNSLQNYKFLNIYLLIKYNCNSIIFWRNQAVLVERKRFLMFFILTVERTSFFEKQRTNKKVRNFFILSNTEQKAFKNLTIFRYLIIRNKKFFQKPTNDHFFFRLLRFLKFLWFRLIILADSVVLLNLFYKNKKWNTLKRYTYNYYKIKALKNTILKKYIYNNSSIIKTNIFFYKLCSIKSFSTEISTFCQKEKLLFSMKSFSFLTFYNSQSHFNNEKKQKLWIFKVIKKKKVILTFNNLKTNFNFFEKNKNLFTVIFQLFSSKRFIIKYKDKTRKEYRSYFVIFKNTLMYGSNINKHIINQRFFKKKNTQIWNILIQQLINNKNQIKKFLLIYKSIIEFNKKKNQSKKIQFFQSKLLLIFFFRYNQQKQYKNFFLNIYLLMALYYSGKQKKVKYKLFKHGWKKSKNLKNYNTLFFLPKHKKKILIKFFFSRNKIKIMKFFFSNFFYFKSFKFKIQKIKVPLMKYKYSWKYRIVYKVFLKIFRNFQKFQKKKSILFPFIYSWNNFHFYKKRIKLNRTLYTFVKKHYRNFFFFCESSKLFLFRKIKKHFSIFKITKKYLTKTYIQKKYMKKQNKNKNFQLFYFNLVKNTKSKNLLWKIFGLVLLSSAQHKKINKILLIKTKQLKNRRNKKWYINKVIKNKIKKNQKLKQYFKSKKTNIWLFCNFSRIIKAALSYKKKGKKKDYFKLEKKNILCFSNCSNRKKKIKLHYKIKNWSTFNKFYKINLKKFVFFKLLKILNSFYIKKFIVKNNAGLIYNFKVLLLKQQLKKTKFINRFKILKTLRYFNIAFNKNQKIFKKVFHKFKIFGKKRKFLKKKKIWRFNKFLKNFKKKNYKKNILIPYLGYNFNRKLKFFSLKKKNLRKKNKISKISFSNLGKVLHNNLFVPQLVDFYEISIYHQYKSNIFWFLSFLLNEEIYCLKKENLLILKKLNDLQMFSRFYINFYELLYITNKNKIRLLEKLIRNIAKTRLFNLSK